MPLFMYTAFTVFREHDSAHIVLDTCCWSTFTLCVDAAVNEIKCINEAQATLVQTDRHLIIAVVMLGSIGYYLMEVFKVQILDLDFVTL